MDAGADIRARADGGQTVLHMAVRRADPDITRTFLEAGGDVIVNARDDDAMAALHWATLAARSEAIIMLLEAGADITLKDDKKRTALSIAHRLGHIATLDVLERWSPPPWYMSVLGLNPRR